jgi:gliding motility-associated-like protein
VDAGRDTSVVAGQPLQFNASSSDPDPDTYSWSPVIELNNPLIPDPLATYTMEDNIIRYAVTATTAFGCTGVGYITVKVFKTKPDIFVPNAFTPGGTLNTVFRPIPVGIASLRYFRIYNRLGQLVYNTSAIGSGWDGRLNGSPQGSGGYVWMVQGTDYLGNVITKSGTMVLVR